MSSSQQPPDYVAVSAARTKPIASSVAANDPAAWEAWPATLEKKNDRTFRPLPAGPALSVRLPVHEGLGLLVVVINPRTPEFVRQAVKISIDGSSKSVLRNPDFPQFLMARFSPKSDACLVGLEWQKPLSGHAGHELPANYMVLIEEVLTLPAKGMFSRYWCTPWRRLLSRWKGGALAWSPLDFPYSHLDGLTYLRKYPEALASVVEGDCKTGAQHFKIRGRLEGRKVILARENPPNPGTVRSILQTYKRHSNQHRLRAELAVFDESTTS